MEGKFECVFCGRKLFCAFMLSCSVPDKTIHPTDLPAMYMYITCAYNNIVLLIEPEMYTTVYHVMSCGSCNTFHSIGVWSGMGRVEPA